MTGKEKKYLKDLGNTIMTKRKELKKTQTEIAANVEISRNHLRRLENGSHPVNIITLRRIAKELNCSVAELLGEV
jgi:XRE family transcriptional regulator, aerobic/anaerobic benzoate catabolism transcriptional regulator